MRTALYDRFALLWYHGKWTLSTIFKITGKPRLKIHQQPNHSMLEVLRCLHHQDLDDTDRQTSAPVWMVNVWHLVRYLPYQPVRLAGFSPSTTSLKAESPQNSLPQTACKYPLRETIWGYGSVFGVVMPRQMYGVSCILMCMLRNINNNTILTRLLFQPGCN